MKKLFIVIPMVITSMVFLTGCAQKQEPKEKKVSTSTVLSQSSDKSIKEATYKSGGVLIRYPQFDLKEKKDKSQKINELIKKDINTIEKHYTSKSKDTTLEVNYEIKMLNENMLSVVYKGYYSDPNNAYPVNFVCTTNIDLKNEASVRLKDCEDIDALTKVLLSDDKYTIKTKDQNLAKVQKDYIKQQDEKWIKDNLLNADFSSDNKYPEIFSYKEENSLTLVIPIQHALGDYMELTIK